jgi:caspase domain-containing protein
MAVASIALTAFGGTALAVTLRHAEVGVSAPVRYESFELPGEVVPEATTSPTAKPKAKPESEHTQDAGHVKQAHVAKPQVVATQVRPSAHAPASRSPAPPAPKPSAPAPAPGGGPANNTALLIGVNHAPGSAPLQGMVRDAELMKKMLIRQGFKRENITLLADGAANKGAILRELDRLAARTSGRGLAVVSISSHASRNATFATGGGGRVSRAELSSRLARVRGRLWTTISTCYAGAFAAPGIEGNGRVAVYTSSANELSYQNERGSVGIVSMIEHGMLDHKLTSAEDAFAYAKKELGKSAPERTPIFKDGIPGEVVPGEMH